MVKIKPALSGKHDIEHIKISALYETFGILAQSGVQCGLIENEFDITKLLNRSLMDILQPVVLASFLFECRTETVLIVFVAIFDSSQYQFKAENW